MFDPAELPDLRRAIQDSTAGDLRLLESLREDVQRLRPRVRPIRHRSTTAVSIVASDGGNNKLVFDPFHVQLVRVVDSYGKPLCVDAVTPWTDTDALSRRQFDAVGNPVTALGRMMQDLELTPLTLNRLSHMIPSGEEVKDSPGEVSPSWVLVYRDLCEWAVLYDRIRYRAFATDTLLVRDGLLRSKLFRGENFIVLRTLIEEAIERIGKTDRLSVFLVGLAKHSKVLQKYTLAMSLEGLLTEGEPRYVAVPREMEARAYVWPEYARGREQEGERGEAPKFVAGDMFWVRFGSRGGDPVWTVDVFSAQAGRCDEVLGYLLADAVDGFPVPFYPRSLQRAHEFAEVVDLDLDILQDEVVEAVRNLLPDSQRPTLDALRLQGDVSGRRYG